MTANERTLASVLRFIRPDDALTVVVKRRLDDAAGTIPLAELIGLDGMELAERLSLADSGLVDICDLLSVADRLIEAFARAARKVEPAAEPATLPSSITLVAPSTPVRREDMKLAGLLAELAEHPADADELLRLIRTTDVVRRAEAKLKGGREWVIMIDGAVNIGETVDYATHLAADFTRPQRKWRDRHWPTTLERAFNLDRRVMLYPFPTSGDPDEVLLVGPDPFGKDWSKLPDDLHEALLWAVLIGHDNLRGNTNYRQITEHLFDDRLRSYLQEILEDYQYAKGMSAARYHTEAKAITRYASDDMLRRAGRSDLVFGSRHPFDSEPERDGDWYLAQLRAIAGRNVDAIAQSVSRGPAVVRSIKTVSGSIRLDRTIVLDRIKTVSGSISGTAYVLATTVIQTTSGGVSENIIDMSPKELYEKAIELGLIAGA